MARQADDNLVLTIEADVTRNLELYDLSLKTLVNNMELPNINQVGKLLQHVILFDRAPTAKQFGAIKVLNQAGEVIMDSAVLEPAPENASQEEYFAVHKAHSQIGLFVSRPALLNGEYVVFLSRRLSNPDGSFGGVVAGTIRLSYFHDLFERLNLNYDASLTLTRRDGIVLMRSPFNIEDIGRKLGHAEVIAQSQTGTSGWFETAAAIDGVKRLYVWRSAKNDPLVVSIGRPLSKIYKGWRTEALRIGLSMLAVGILTIFLTIWLTFELRKRSVLEIKLAGLATTDALTGLWNRRRFAEVLKSEWHRSMRHGTSLSLLMIDADHFKSHNDSFGHQAGDKVLIEIASCIAKNVRRASDCSARYGGEEFAVLLPETSQQDAFLIAERIRSNIEGLQLPVGRVTVSVGVASLTPTPQLDRGDLVSAADAALYHAKSLGRNRTFPVCGMSQLPADPHGSLLRPAEHRAA